MPPGGGAKRASKFPLLITAGHVTRKQRDAKRKTRQLEPKGANVVDLQAAALSKAVEKSKLN